MNKLSCFILDDEPAARKLLREYIEDIPFLSLCGESNNPLNALGQLAAEQVDILLLDIQMPKMTGLEMIKLIPPKAQVIITTAYPEYALQGYEFDVLDYLLKPVNFQRFLKAVTKAQAKSKDIENTRNYFFIKCDGKVERINFTDVVYIEAKSNYVEIHTESRKYLTYLTFKKLETFLPEKMFIRIHKSYIISIDKLQSIEDNMAHLGNIVIPISESNKSPLMNLISQGLLKR